MFRERAMPELVKLLGAPALLPGKTALIEVHGNIKQVGNAWQCRGFLEEEMARDVNERLLAQHRVLRQHPIEIGSEPVGQVIGLDRPAKPPRMEATRNSVDRK